MMVPLFSETMLLSSRDGRSIFETLLNCESEVSDVTIESIPQHPVREPFADLPSLEEVYLRINQIKTNKAPGPDGVPAEIFKVGGSVILQKLYQLLLKVWECKLSSECQNCDHL